MIKNIKIRFSLLLLCFCLLFLASPILAAKTFFETPTQEIGLNQLFEVNIFLNSDNESINALEGKIIFPPDLLEVKRINDGNSLINLWLERPAVIDNGQIAFSGITPGGYDDQKGLIFSIVFLTKKIDSSLVAFSNMRVLLNDGQGTAARLTSTNLDFSVSDKILADQPDLDIKDNKPPEIFTPEIISDPDVFNGQWVLIFNAQDKISGIDHYEVKEGKKAFVIAQSPYLLRYQDLDRDITVKAIDKHGNERIIVLPARHELAWYKNYPISSIIILGLILLYLIWKITWRRRKK